MPFLAVLASATSACSVDDRAVMTLSSTGGVGTSSSAPVGATPVGATPVGATPVGATPLSASSEGGTGGFGPGPNGAADAGAAPIPSGAMDTDVSAPGEVAGDYRIEVSVTGPGTVTSVPPGIDCATTCSAQFSGPVELQARTANGDEVRFAGWTGGACSGVRRGCRIQGAADVSVSATFEALTANLVFATSQRFATDLGSAVAYDRACNEAANAAGINDAELGAYVAMVSDSASLARVRLGSARGWVRMDGRPFADSAASLFAGQIYNAIQLDEYGAPTLGEALTGTNGDGSLAPTANCDDWTSPEGYLVHGDPSGGPLQWLSNSFFACGGERRLLCLGKSRNTAVSPTVTDGRLIWISSTAYELGSSQTPDALCRAERPAGVTSAAAFIASTDRAAAALLAREVDYVRPDGTLVGAGAQIANGIVESGVWQEATGRYLSTFEFVLTGSASPAFEGTAESTCADWSDTTLTGRVTGRVNYADRQWWSSAQPDACDFGARIYCVETAP